MVGVLGYESTITGFREIMTVGIAWLKAISATQSLPVQAGIQLRIMYSKVQGSKIRSHFHESEE
jgi:hypothetical protein